MTETRKADVKALARRACGATCHIIPGAGRDTDTYCRCTAIESAIEEALGKTKHEFLDAEQTVSRAAIKIMDLTDKLRAAEQRAKEVASAHADCYWHDCGLWKDVQAGSDPKTWLERGADHCLFEGTTVCTLCQLADAKRGRDAAEALLRVLVEEADFDARSISEAGMDRLSAWDTERKERGR